MKLDFTTLFVLILLNSIGFAIVWAIISVSYRSLLAARYWFAALMMTFLSGPFLIFGHHAQWLNYTGNTLVILGLGLIWQGIRVFRQLPPLWGWMSALVAASILAMIVFGVSQPANNVIFAVAQIVQMTLALVSLLNSKDRQIGIWVAAGSCGMLILGQSLEAVTNLFRIAGMLSTEAYYNYASWFLVLAILGVSISNLGFLLMTVDKMRHELYVLAAHDELTGLPNRRALIDKLTIIEKTAGLSKENVTTFMIDLDRFKMINDTYGHPAGDAALIHFSNIIQKNLREDDFFARMGGDEFCILMPSAKPDEVQKTAQNIIRDLNSTPLIWKGKELFLSASIGTHRWTPQSGAPLLLSLAHADDHLIQTKNMSQLNLRATGT